jgi:hypothetical protein
MYTFQGIFTNSNDPLIISAAKRKWPFCRSKYIQKPFEGIAIYRNNQGTPVQVAKDNQRLEDELDEFSLQFPNMVFIHLWVECHGSICVYDGFACQKAQIFVDNRGKESDPFSRVFERDKLREVVGALGVTLDEAAYFEPFERGFFELDEKAEVDLVTKPAKRFWWKFWE